MSKTIGSSLLTDIQKSVATLATCIKIVRQDFKTIRLTNHDTDITIDDGTYVHTIPFTLEAIQSGSNFSVENADIRITCDEITTKLAEFEAGLYDKAEVTILQVDYSNPAHGAVIMRQGWFGQIVPSTNGFVKVTTVGLLKVLDFEVGRVYQPSCDADLGDKRCKVAIDLSQSFEFNNSYGVGEWFYHLDPTEMTAITLTNDNFEAQGVVGVNTAITGWTKSPGCKVRVAHAQNTLIAYEGTYSLIGDSDGTSNVVEQYVYQDINLVTAGLDTTKIDAGKLMFASNTKLAQDLYAFDQPRFKVDVLDANGEVIDVHDTGYIDLGEYAVWRGRWLVFPLLAGARTARIYLYMRKTDADIFNAEFDYVKAWWWDHTVDDPYRGIIHAVKRVLDVNPANTLKYVANASFDAATVASTNSNVSVISGWTRPNTTADWWQIATGALSGIAIPDGTFMLRGGDDSSGAQKTYELEQTINLTGDASLGLDAAKVLLSAYTCKGTINICHYDTVSDAQVTVSFYNASNVLLSSNAIRAYGTRSDAPISADYTKAFSIPATATKLKVKLQAKSGTGVSSANVGFDDIRLFIVDTMKADKNDLVTGFGDDTTAFSTAAGGFTWIGNLVLQAHTAHIGFDVVSAVTSDKQFIGTDISGASGTFETGLIRWLSGANTGQTNLIRVWTTDTQEIKLYFNCVNTITVGDRFQYVRACHKRFTGDCLTVFDNAINFRGFPYLPGRLK